jgi:hypothetical protein
MSAPPLRYGNGKDPVLSLVCPRCGRAAVPFARLGGPQKEMHRRGRSGGGCRYVVIVDPFGDDHEWVEVAHHESIESVWRRERVEWDERHSRLLLEALG